MQGPYKPLHTRRFLSFRASVSYGSRTNRTRMIRIRDVTTKQTADLNLSQKGMETVQCLMKQACSAFGVETILRLVVGDLVIARSEWNLHSVDTYMLMGEPPSDEHRA